MQSKKSYFVNFATCNDGIIRDCRLFDKLKDARKFAAGLKNRYLIERSISMIYPGFSKETERVVIEKSVSISWYDRMSAIAAQKAAAV